MSNEVKPSAKAAWKVAGNTASYAGLGVVLSLLFNGASDLKTMLVWGAIGAGIGVLDGIYEASKIMTAADKKDAAAKKGSGNPPPGNGPT